MIESDVAHAHDAGASTGFPLIDGNPWRNAGNGASVPPNAHTRNPSVGKLLVN